MSEMRVAAKTPSFFELYRRGDVAAEDIESYVGRSHADHDPAAQDLSLYDPFALPCILRARQSGNLVEIMAEPLEQLRTADRQEDRTIIFSLGNWLKAQSRH